MVQEELELKEQFLRISFFAQWVVVHIDAEMIASEKLLTTLTWASINSKCDK